MNDLMLSVPGITCGHCATAISEAVRTVPGVTGVDVNIAGKRVCVAGSGEESAIRAAIAEAGYAAE